jgi:hypothetical protein
MFGTSAAKRLGISQDAMVSLSQRETSMSKLYAADHGRLAHVPQLLRANEWWAFKLPTVFGITYIYLLSMEMPIETAAIVLAALLPIGAATAGFGHCLNDLCDEQNDRQCGKLVGKPSPPGVIRIVLCVALLTVAFGTTTLLSRSLLRASNQTERTGCSRNHRRRRLRICGAEHLCGLIAIRVP